MQVYLVGGAVRDNLLGVTVKEKDWVVVGATEIEMLTQGYQKVGKDFPVFLHAETKEEYALARTERKTGPGYHGFSCYFAPTVTLEEDLLRRDLTINAIAQTSNGEFIDPYGGVNDLNSRVLRHISTAFTEDPLRVLRVARFAAKLANFSFTVALETLELMQQIVAGGELANLTPERIWKEFEKALCTDHPSVFFETLRTCGALEVIFPALAKLWGVPQTSKYHPEIDTGIHIMLSLEMISKLTIDPVIKFAVLCHDLGKGETPANEWPKHHGHEARGIKPIRAWCEKYKVPNKYLELALQVAYWHLHVHKIYELRSTTIVNMLIKMDAYRRPERFEAFLLACEADARGRAEKQNDAYPQAAYLRTLFTASQQIDTDTLVARGLSGAKLGQAILRERIKAIKLIKSGN